MTSLIRILRTAAISLPLLLAGCQGTMQRVADCKVGDWRVIGHKDGIAGEKQEFADRKDFCSGYDKGQSVGDPAAQYIAGWAQGNWDLWSGKGSKDGRDALPLSSFDSHASTPEVRKKGTPVNRPAYEAGWLIGNSEYWDGVGKRDGTQGRALAYKETAGQSAAEKGIRFDDAAYVNGWQTGNRAFWQDAGYQDARRGIPDTAFKARAAAATVQGVQIQEDVYRRAWAEELVNYWRNLGTQDAVSGKDLAMRRAEAQRTGLKVLGDTYRETWEARLVEYWTRAGLDDGFGKPFQLESRIANAAYNRVFVIPGTRAIYTASWTAENAKYCSPDNAFALGRGNRGMAFDVCHAASQNQLRHAYLSGQDFEVAATKLAYAHTEANELSGRLSDARNRLRRLERDIRSDLDNKDRKPTDETAKQDKQREQERRELNAQILRLDRKLDEARGLERLYEQEMQKLQREIYAVR